jgi:hypothetical protein
VPWLLFIASFFLTSAVKLGHGDFHDVLLVGWDAAIGSVVFGQQLTGSMDARAILYFLWPITNLVMLASPLVLSSRWVRLRTFLPHAMLLSAALNGLPPFMAPGADLVFRVGYYVWFASFALASGALYMLRAMSKAGPDRAA